MSAIFSLSVTEISEDDVVRRGIAIYETKLKNLLEPGSNGQVVAIHLDSEDYCVAASSGRAMRVMRQIHPEGQLLLHTIGNAEDSGLAARMLGTRIAAKMQ